MFWCQCLKDGLKVLRLKTEGNNKKKFIALVNEKIDIQISNWNSR